MAKSDIDLGPYKLGRSDTVDYAITPKKGLNKQVVLDISSGKNEPLRRSVNEKLSALTSKRESEKYV